MASVNRSRVPLRQLGILGSTQGRYARELAFAARVRNSSTEIHMVSFDDLTVGLTSDGLAVTSKAIQLAAMKQNDAHVNSKNIDLLAMDALVVRTMPLGSLEQVIFRMDALQALEREGIPVLNPPRALEIAIDKWLTLERLSKSGIAVPPTWACQSRTQAMEAYESLGRDVVVKPLFGGEGRGIVRVTDVDMAWRVFGTLQQIDSILYVQQFIPNFGYDIRVLVIGQDLLSVKRRAPTGGWRTNISQGSIAEVHDLSSHEEEIAWSAVKATGGSLLGIDLLPSRDGAILVLEVNAVPGWAGTAAALGVNVADRVIEHLEELNAQRT